MQYWYSVLDEVTHKDESEHAFLLTQSGRLNLKLPVDELSISVFKERRDLRTYYLGDSYPELYLTKREAECMFWLIQDCTIAQTASHMGLSARTVEFYMKNLKTKLSCHTKKDLVEKILQTSLLTQLEKEGMRIERH